MMARHWLRDVIDMEIDCRGDGCTICNERAKEIADSLALYGLDAVEADMSIRWDGIWGGTLDKEAKAEAGVL